MKRMMAGVFTGLGLAAALPAAAQEGDGVTALCLAQGEAQEACDCTAEALKGELGDSYGTFEEFGAAYAVKVNDEGLGPVTAWGAALDEVGLGRVQANPLGDAYRDALSGCGA